MPTACAKQKFGAVFASHFRLQATAKKNINCLGFFTSIESSTNLKLSFMKKVLFSILLIASIGAKAQSWSPKATGFATPNRLLNSISIANTSDIWATAINNNDNLNPDYTIHEFTLSTDGGNTWTPGTIDLGATTAELGISSITAISSTTAWISAFPDVVDTTQKGGIWKTINGGSNWTKQESALFNSTASYTNFVHFWDANNGIAQGDPEADEFEIYTTTDGGTNWTKVAAENIPNPSPIGEEYGYFNRYCVSGNTIWFGTNKGRIFRSTDKGVNWTVYQSPSTDFTLDRFTFSDSNKGLLMKYDLFNATALYSTSDGGENWTLVPRNGTLFKNNITYVPGTSIVICSSSSNPLGSSISTDNGRNWTVIDYVYHGELAFLEDGFGFSAGLNTSSTVEGISRYLKTVEVEVTPIDTITYNGLPQGPSEARTTGTGTSYTFSYVGVSPTVYAASSTPPIAAGSYTATATVAANGIYASGISRALAFTINKKGLTITGLSGTDKEYNGNTSATATGTAVVDGLVLSETVTLGGTPTYTFANANIGTAIRIATTGYAISGTAAANYTIIQPTLSANITVATPTVTVFVQAYTYSGNNQGPNSVFTISTGTVAYSYTGVTPTVYSTSSILPSNAGTYTVTATTEADANCVSASSSATAFTINKKGLTITGLSGTDKVYDGNTFAAATGTAVVDGLVLSETVTLGGTPTYTFASSDVGTAINIYTTGYTISGTAAVNYGLGQPQLSANITTPLKVSSFDINKQISAYPNPTKGVLHLDSKNLLIKDVSVYDLLGRRVIYSEFSSLKRVSLDLKTIENGSYILKITSDSGETGTMRIIKN